ncbi:MAG: HIT family protein [Phycisphaerae bacterium]
MPADPACIFCKIIAGAISCERVFEDERVLAFLDISPLAEGHTLVVPKTHAAALHELEPAVAGELLTTAGRMGLRVMQATGAAAYNVLQNNGAEAGQIVMHVHLHVIPRRAGDGLGFRWHAHQRTAEQLRATGDRIRGLGAG